MAQDATTVAQTQPDFATATAFLQRYGTELEEPAGEVGRGKDKVVFKQAKVCVPEAVLYPQSKIATKSLFFLPSAPGFDISAQ